MPRATLSLMRRLALALAAAALAGCSSPAAPPTALFTPSATLSPPPAAQPSCGWYTPMIGQAYGQVVTVTAQGPACRSEALIRWIATASGKPWASTTIAPGTLIAQMAKGGTVIKIWQSGSALATDDTAGGLADSFARAGWTPQQPQCGQAGCGPPVTSPESPVGA